MAEARAGASRGAGAGCPPFAARGTGRHVPIVSLKFPEPTALLCCSRAWGVCARGASGSVGGDGAGVASHGHGARSGKWGGRCGRPAGASSKREMENQRETQQFRFWVPTPEGREQQVGAVSRAGMSPPLLTSQRRRRPASISSGTEKQNGLRPLRGVLCGHKNK